MNTCPCCSDQLLRHARHNSIYWFCPHCWQEMPNLSDAIEATQQAKKQRELVVNRLVLAYR